MMNAPLTSLLDLAPVIPVVTLEDVRHAAPLARALLAGGVEVIELTLRTPAALACLRAIADEVPEIVLGAGTVLDAEQADAAVAAGAGFVVTPGVTPALLRHLPGLGVPALPGAATVSEALTLLEAGISELKFFPAGPAGGPAYLSALAGPLPQVRFCPTGGISAGNAADYLALPNVGCVGGSWLTPRDALAAQDWARVTELARATLDLR